MPAVRQVFVGQVYNTNYETCEVISLLGRNVVIKFHKTGTIKTVASGNLLNGKVKDHNFPNILGKAYLGEGKFKFTQNKRLYKLWYNMLIRCLAKQISQVCDRWLNFQNFCSDIQKKRNWNTKGFDLDKDLRILGNRLYSPETTSFVPHFINTILGFPKDKSKYEFDVGISYSSRDDLISVRGKFFGNRKNIYFDNIKDAQRFYCRERAKHVRRKAKEYKHLIHREVYRTLSTIKPSYFMRKL